MGIISVGYMDDILVFKVEGYLSYDEIIEALKEHSPYAIRHIIWHLSDATTTDLTGDHIRGLPKIAKQYTTNRKEGKTAFICEHDHFFGLSRMYSTVSELIDAPYMYNTFKTVDEALEWFRE